MALFRGTVCCLQFAARFNVCACAYVRASHLLEAARYGVTCGNLLATQGCSISGTPRMECSRHNHTRSTVVYNGPCFPWRTWMKILGSMSGLELCAPLGIHVSVDWWRVFVPWMNESINRADLHARSGRYRSGQIRGSKQRQAMQGKQRVNKMCPKRSDDREPNPFLGKLHVSPDSDELQTRRWPLFCDCILQGAAGAVGLADACGLYVICTKCQIVPTSCICLPYSPKVPVFHLQLHLCLRRTSTNIEAVPLLTC
ncbi:uncharacterized protein BDZ83DRAFT_232964 [Colletotrichum acutatum]|uniref:Secreted protein n=1 Tax=Glomerella acutata TaxID=27357 RepID=A0AAD8XGE0_GLOAC|nr:uncharacterized protein BDZ83DRAFT_232964 [Colletotrichum acutatum]KAK1726974.1 hypothetical protein BDZ83DRAFT_232964 [Colletotrichum acutatum]